MFDPYSTHNPSFIHQRPQVWSLLNPELVLSIRHPRFDLYSTQNISFIHQTPQAWYLLNPLCQIVSCHRSPRFSPRSTQTCSQFHAEEVPGLIHDHRIPSVSCRQKPQGWPMLKPDSHTISRSTSPRFYPCSAQILSPFHAAESPGLMVYVQPLLSISCQQNPQVWWSMLNPNSQSVSCSRIPRFDDPCSTQTPSFMHQKPQIWSMLIPSCHSVVLCCDLGTDRKSGPNAWFKQIFIHLS